MNLDFLKNEERIALCLKSLYKSFGYTEYKLPGFEEYSLYAENGSFLADRDVVAFNAGGKLLALRPDVTLSIVKNVKAGGTRKLFYDEKIYRKTAVGGLSEVSQLGVEIIGEVDDVARTELCSLMLGTLNAVGKRFIVDVSHMGIISKVLEYAALYDGDRDFALECLRGKNAHDFNRFAAARGIDSAAINAFEKLISIPSEAADALKSLKDISRRVDVCTEIAELEEMLKLSGDGLCVDFSIVGDSEYYNGVIFKGYVEGIPHAVLSGGRYDRLMRKFGKSGEAIGFALYLGELGKYLDDAPDMPDIAVVYDDKSSNSALVEAAKLRIEGKKVLLCREAPEDFSGTVKRAEVD